MHRLRRPAPARRPGRPLQRQTTWRFFLTQSHLHGLYEQCDPQPRLPSVRPAREACEPRRCCPQPICGAERLFCRSAAQPASCSQLTRCSHDGFKCKNLQPWSSPLPASANQAQREVDRYSLMLPDQPSASWFTCCYCNTRCPRAVLASTGGGNFLAMCNSAISFTVLEVDLCRAKKCNNLEVQLRAASTYILQTIEWRQCKGGDASLAPPSRHPDPCLSQVERHLLDLRGDG